jgi:hypothetical protein
MSFLNNFKDSAQKIGVQPRLGTRSLGRLSRGRRRPWSASSWKTKYALLSSTPFPPSYPLSSLPCPPLSSSERGVKTAHLLRIRWWGRGVGTRGQTLRYRGRAKDTGYISYIYRADPRPSHRSRKQPRSSNPSSPTRTTQNPLSTRSPRRFSTVQRGAFALFSFAVKRIGEKSRGRRKLREGAMLRVRAARRSL